MTPTPRRSAAEVRARGEIRRQAILTARIAARRQQLAPSTPFINSGSTR